MKRNLLKAILLTAVIFTLNSCSSDASEASTVEAKSQAVVNYTYTASELETMKLINDYRVSVGLSALEPINFISVKSEGHDNYMISNNVVNHDGFVDRSENIIKTLGAKTVGENIAYNYNTPSCHSRRRSISARVVRISRPSFMPIISLRHWPNQLPV